MSSEIAGLRKEYKKGLLSEEDISNDPFRQFDLWFKDAINFHQGEVNVMTLATVTHGRPSQRIVLLKGYDHTGLTFFTNYESAKGKAIAETPFVALNFFWQDLERQIRIEGNAMKIEASKSEEYFHSRPRGSQIGAWVSPQSQEIAGRSFLDEQQLAFEEKFAEVEPIPKPSHWGGYKVIPDYFEFWQGRPSRLHDRLAYRKENTDWKIIRLAP